VTEASFTAEHPLEPDAALGWVGDRLADVAGTTIGRVEGAFADVDSGEPVWLVIRIGRLGRRTAVPFDYAAGGARGHVWVPYPKPTLRDAPEVDPAVGATAALELELSDHFGLGPAHGRRQTLAERDPAALSCVPVEAGDPLPA
jgi:hypothetical protein